MIKEIKDNSGRTVAHYDTSSQTCTVVIDYVMNKVINSMLPDWKTTDDLERKITGTNNEVYAFAARRSKCRFGCSRINQTQH